MSENIEKTIRLIRKLIAHQQSAQAIGSLAEAEAFAARISELADKHRLEIASIGPEVIESAVREIDWMPVAVGLPIKNHSETWMKILGSGVAAGHRCKLLQYRCLNSISFVGLESDVAVCEAMMTILIRGMLASFNTARKGRRLKRLEFYKGFAMHINSRYNQMRRDQDANHSGAETALMCLTDQLIEKAIEGVRKGSFRLPKMQDKTSFMAGYKAAGQQDLSTRLVKAGRVQKQLGAGS